jgi:hypothetical protein
LRCVAGVSEMQTTKCEESRQNEKERIRNKTTEYDVFESTRLGTMKRMWRK